MAETKQTIKVGVANQGERNIKVSDLLEHEPKKITYSGSLVFFEHNGVFLSMDRLDYTSVFGNLK